MSAKMYMEGKINYN